MGKEGKNGQLWVSVPGKAKPWCGMLLEQRALITSAVIKNQSQNRSEFKRELFIRRQEVVMYRFCPAKVSWSSKCLGEL